MLLMNIASQTLSRHSKNKARQLLQITAHGAQSYFATKLVRYRPHQKKSKKNATIKNGSALHDIMSGQSAR
ncbi:hypothetical protein D3C77_231590 [compost metagenome]|jgi:hypothetical protein